MRWFNIASIFLVLVLSSCRNESTYPKPKSYLRIDLPEKGYYKRNPGRAATAGNTKTFQYEFQLWGKLNLFENKERYIPKIGYNFNWDKINGYISRGYEEIIKE